MRGVFLFLLPRRIAEAKLELPEQPLALAQPSNRLASFSFGQIEANRGASPYPYGFLRSRLGYKSQSTRRQTSEVLRCSPRYGSPQPNGRRSAEVDHDAELSLIGVRWSGGGVKLKLDDRDASRHARERGAVFVLAGS